MLGQRHFDVQLMGGAALRLGNIAEMKTGEGKTWRASAGRPATTSPQCRGETASVMTEYRLWVDLY